MVTCQSANQLKTPAKFSWVFKIVSQFGSLGYTIMGKTADLTVVQKTIIDTLHKEDKTQTFIAKEAVCSQSAVSKHVNRKLSGRKKCGRKRCTTNRENRSLMRIVKQNRFKNLGELHKEWTEAGVKASRAPHTDVSRNLATVVVRGVLPGLRRRTGLLPSGPKSYFHYNLLRCTYVCVCVCVCVYVCVYIQHWNNIYWEFLSNNMILILFFISYLPVSFIYLFYRNRLP